MHRQLYLRPLGLLHGAVARAARAAGRAGALAGGDIAFSLVEAIEGEPGKARRDIRGFADLAASGDTAIADRLARLTTPRPPIAGLDLDRPLLMGVVNVTPDSFSDGGLYNRTDEAVRHAAALARQGADIVDIGGESTRPGADPLALEEELDRVLPVLDGARGIGARLSIDTRKAAAMSAAAERGVHILNDVTALSHEPGSLGAAARSGLTVVLMHAQGDPRTMQDKPEYRDVLLEVYDYLEARVAACEAAGIPRAKLIADPGIGFGKTLDHNLTLLAGLSLFHGLGVALCLGASRKRFIGALTGENEPRRRAHGSVAAALAGAAQGAHVLRVHDVAETRQALTVWRPAMGGESPI